MNWLFLIASLAFFAFGLRKNNYALIWQWNQFRLIRAQNRVFLIDGDTAYQYAGGESDETYVPAIELNSGRQKDILNHRYLLEWIQEPPLSIHYPSDQTEHILNYLSDILKLEYDSEP